MPLRQRAQLNHSPSPAWRQMRLPHLALAAHFHGRLQPLRSPAILSPPAQSLSCQTSCLRLRSQVNSHKVMRHSACRQCSLRARKRIQDHLFCRAFSHLGKHTLHRHPMQPQRRNQLLNKLLLHNGCGQQLRQSRQLPAQRSQPRSRCHRFFGPPRSASRTQRQALLVQRLALNQQCLHLAVSMLLQRLSAAHTLPQGLLQLLLHLSPSMRLPRYRHSCLHNLALHRRSHHSRLRSLVQH